MIKSRKEYDILCVLKNKGCVDRLHSMSVYDLMDYEDGVFGCRTNINKLLAHLEQIGMISKGIMDSRAITWFITENGLKEIS